MGKVQNGFWHSTFRTHKFHTRIPWNSPCPSEHWFKTFTVYQQDTKEDPKSNTVNCGDEGSCEDSDPEVGGESEGSIPKPKKRGIGPYFKDGTLTAYSLWTRISTPTSISVPQGV